MPEEEKKENILTNEDHMSNIRKSTNMLTGLVRKVDAGKHSFKSRNNDIGLSLNQSQKNTIKNDIILTINELIASATEIKNNLEKAQ